MNISTKELSKQTKSGLIALCVEHQLPFDDKSSKQELIDLLVNALGEEASFDDSALQEEQAQKSAAELEEAKKAAMAREISRRLGNRVANNYEQELARRKGVGTHISGAEAVALEIERRRRAFNR